VVAVMAVVVVAAATVVVAVNLMRLRRRIWVVVGVYFGEVPGLLLR
jgi:hypothetical protein